MINKDGTWFVHGAKKWYIKVGQELSHLLLYEPKKEATIALIELLA
ncbi:hypothetical protein ACFPQ1_37765 [Rhodocytophaga aerolata]